MLDYKELQEELKRTIAEAKKANKNTVPYIRLKRKANELHVQLIKVERMINNFK
jgi:hypothetical protein